MGTHAKDAKRATAFLEQGLLPDYNEPVIIPCKKATVEDFCNRIHKVRWAPTCSPATAAVKTAAPPPQTEAALCALSCARGEVDVSLCGHVTGHPEELQVRAGVGHLHEAPSAEGVQL